MKLMIDPHTHTIASGHAYSTINEMALAAAHKGIEILGITDHGPALDVSCHEDHFKNFKVIDRNLHGVTILMGVEANIINIGSGLDLGNELLQSMDIVIASLHTQSFQPGTIEYNTKAVVKAIQNPYVTILGHPDDGKFPVCYEDIVIAAKKENVLIEVNNASLTHNSFRKNGRENSLTILNLCKKHGADVILSSDAHFMTSVGDVSIALEIIKEADFPLDRIVNFDKNHFNKYIT